MWAVIGLLLAIALGSVTVLAISNQPSAQLDDHPWLVTDTAKVHAGIMAGLAGFAFTGVVLIVTLARDRSRVADSSLDAVVVMFLVAYLWWIGNAFLISYLPDGQLTSDLVPRVHFSLASTIEYRTVFLSWFALLPLLEANGLGRISHILYFLLPASLLFGSVLISVAADGLGLLKISETYLSAAVAAILALAYTSTVAFAVPAARSPYSPQYLAIVIFCINGFGFSVASLTSLARRYPRLARFYDRYGRRIVILDMHFTMASLAFLMLSIIGLI
jgi:hypothetical protein